MPSADLLRTRTAANVPIKSKKGICEADPFFEIKAYSMMNEAD